MIDQLMKSVGEVFQYLLNNWISIVALMISVIVAIWNHSNDSRKKAFDPVVTQAIVEPTNGSSIPVLDLEGKGKKSQVSIYPIHVDLLSGSLVSIYPITAYFPMGKKDSGDFELLLDHKLVWIQADFPVFKATKSSRKIGIKKQVENFLLRKGAFSRNNEMTLKPETPLGLIMDGGIVVFQQTYLVRGSDHSTYLWMFWYDSKNQQEGYLDGPRSLANMGENEPEWARFQFRKLHDYLAENGINTQ